MQEKVARPNRMLLFIINDVVMAVKPNGRNTKRKTVIKTPKPIAVFKALFQDVW